MIVIDGRKHADKILLSNKRRVALLKRKGICPGLATIIVGSDPASKIYVDIKQKACERVGIYTEHYCLPTSVTQGDLLGLIGKLNKRKRIYGILVQLPLPKKFNLQKILSAIDPGKDVDGFNPINLGALMNGDEAMAPATPRGIIHLIETVTKLEGKNVVVVNHSIVVGKPLAMMLLNRDATVSVCHVKTRKLADYTRKADIVVTAVGVPNLIKKDMVKTGAIVIDAGISRVEGKVVGDVHKGVFKKARAITLVPGGVGPMTVAMIIDNTVNSAN